MAQSSSEIQYLIDRAAIHDLLTRYFQGLDRGSPEQVRSCFTDDVQCHYDKRAPTKGIEAFMRSLRYLDRMRRVKSGWRISDRIHTLDWSCQVPANFAITLAQRVSNRSDRALPFSEA
ncbi:MAG: nuclear transport factor 2 family protein [Betaproteobacteria bacterium]|nr:nuclear transport factor 2 family protein [Betaproteobacteria bacterium]